ERMNINTNNTSTLALGGAILNFHTLTVRDSALFGNTTPGNGGAITNVGGAAGGSSLTIINSSLYNNSAGQVGGAIWQNGAGQASTRLTILNSTISGNIADSNNDAGDQDGGGVHVHSLGSVLIHSTIIANNTKDGAVTPDEIILQNGEPTLDPASANNLVEDAGTDGGLGALGNGNITGQDPMLGSPSFAGGSTPSLPLLVGSPALDMGSNTQSLAIDQRGFSRSSGAGVDIGAFEQQPISIVVDSAGDGALDGFFGPGQLTLREALTITNNNPGDDTVTVDGSLSGSTVTLTAGQLEITDDLTLTGPGAAADFVIDANTLSRVLLVDDLDYSANRVVSITGFTMQNGFLLDGNFGAGIANEDALTLTDVTVTNNALEDAGAGDFGGGIFTGDNNGTDLS
ncbi:MAG: hypothetical protein K8E66_13160, partial [Phycisphaerales bacterium]|nr:hypothetical protein [Phycisphaerales bacterium]